MALSRKIHWIASADESNNHALVQLEAQLHQYYAGISTRANYDELIGLEVAENPITTAFVRWLQSQSFNTMLEVGCGNGRVFDKIYKSGISISYTGAEIHEATINNNSKQWPNQQWDFASVYNLPYTKESFDLCCCFYVLEHLVFPEKALNIMFDLVKPGGSLVLVFPDFSATQRFPSQHLGLSQGRSTLQKIKQGKFIDALITFYDIKCKLKPHLKDLANTHGQFLINSKPVCLHYQHSAIWPDIDAVYLANKGEIEYWAKSIGASVSFPAGKNSPFDEHAFIEIHKNS